MRNSIPSVPSNRPPPNDGTLYRVRNRSPNAAGEAPTVWGEALTYADASKLRDKITAEKKSRSMCIEPMPTDLEAVPDIAVATSEPSVVPPVRSAPPIKGTDYRISSAMTKTTLTSSGVITEAPSGHRVLINGIERTAPAAVDAGDVVECMPLVAPLATARAVASDAVAEVMRQNRRVPVDVTLKVAKPRTTPAPPDRTVSMAVVVRLGVADGGEAQPLEAPQKVAEAMDGEPLPEDAITDDDLPDLSADLGAGATEADVAHAQRQAEMEKAGK